MGALYDFIHRRIIPAYLACVRFTLLRKRNTYNDDRKSLIRGFWLELLEYKIALKLSCVIMIIIIIITITITITITTIIIIIILIIIIIIIIIIITIGGNSYELQRDLYTTVFWLNKEKRYCFSPHSVLLIK